MELVRYTEPPDWYYEPRERRVRRIGRREGVKDITPDELDFVLDLCCAANGAPVTRFNEYSPAVEDAAEAYARTQADTQGAPGDYYYNQRVREKARKEYVKRQRQQHELLEELDLSQIPGDSTLQRALRVLKLLRLYQELLEQYSYYNDYDDYYRNRVQPLPGMLQGGIESVQQLDRYSTETLMLIQGGDEAGQDHLQLGLELIFQEVELKEMLRVSRQLDQMSELTSRHAQITPDPEGEDVELRDIRDVGEMVKAGQQVFGLPRQLMLYRAVTGQMSVREPVTHREKRQLLYLLIDSSGSMKGLSAGRAAGVVVNRLREVIAGNAEVYLRFFDTVVGPTEYHADSRDSALELMEAVTNPKSYHGGGTSFIQPLTEVGKRMTELVEQGVFRDPEIFMVTDGEDAHVPDRSVLGAVKLHTIQVGNSERAELAELAKATGGLNIFVKPEAKE